MCRHINCGKIHNSSVEMFYNFKRTLIENSIVLAFEFSTASSKILFSQGSNFAMHDGLDFALIRKINLIFIYLLV